MDLNPDAAPAAAPATRRRGAALEQALLDAAWDQLVEGGYGAFTFEAVAERAGTSRPVVYRRWPDKTALIRDAITHGVGTRPLHLPDTGSLRDDVVGLLRSANAERSQLMPLFSVLVGAYYADSGTTLADLRERILRDRGPGGTRRLLERAAARGEVDLARLPDRVAELPFDLFRHQMMMTMRPLDDTDIEGIVDEVFMPLVQLSR
ncbi:TetR/AcrR family transcriptional regulator [Agromyces intestinalis]|uniref:TetR/AcrR family transcriptional regulator n=1 Tax=Agromyces intestinalis TaxID=2592652 RepID=A0A5C1YIW1_9MICO|nr:TetR/AcrR family transcriptional regulator [Agromyces intestinalis]QEO14997.1 TetR/AcrR family transcriptional regulator [Agromyces intestinalis]